MTVDVTGLLVVVFCLGMLVGALLSTGIDHILDWLEDRQERETGAVTGSGAQRVRSVPLPDDFTPPEASLSPRLKVVPPEDPEE